MKGTTSNKNIMQKETVVKSYVRHKQSEVVEETTEPPTLALIMLGAIGVLLAVVYIQLALGVGLVLGAAYGVKTIISNNPRTQVVEAVTEPVNASEAKPKRHYAKRLTVNMYDTGKTIKI